MQRLAFSRQGSGPCLVLLHALGASRASWDPVVPLLTDRFDVLAVDLPGFGNSAAIPAHIEPHPAFHAEQVDQLLTQLGIDRPHVVGNSLGGWVALELAHRRPVGSLTLLSPAGQWPGGAPLYCRVTLQASRWACLHAAGALNRMVNHRAGRVLVLGQTHGRPDRMTPDQARRMIGALRTASGFEATLAATAHRSYAPEHALPVPVTVAFGSRDRVLLAPRWRSIDELPASAVRAELPGCGHVPMADDPRAVADLITSSVRRAACSAAGSSRPG